MHCAVDAIVGPEPALSLFTGGAEHLLAEIGWLKLLLHREVLRLRARGLLVENDFRGLFISDEYVDAALSDRHAEPPGAAALTAQIRNQRDRISSRIQESLPLVRLSGLFSLHSFERQVIVACAAPELDLNFEALYSYTQNDVNRKRPTIDLMLRIFSDSPDERIRLRAAFSPQNPLIRHGLLACIDDPQHRDQSRLARPLRIDERILDYLLDRPAVDHRLQPFASLVEPRKKFSDLLLPSSLKQHLVNALSCFGDQPQAMIFCGPDGTGKRSAAEALSHEQRRPLIAVDLGRALASPLPLQGSLSLLSREAALHHANLFLAPAGAAPPEQRTRRVLDLDRTLFPVGCRIFIAIESESDALSIPSDWPRLSFNFPAPDFDDRVTLWSSAIAATGTPSPAVDADALANQFVLTPGAIHSACRVAATEARLRRPHDPWMSSADLAAAARGESNQALSRFARKVETIHEWRDLVLPNRAMQQLREVNASHKYRHLVYSEWGFDRRLAMGKGLNVLFCGPSGTGKTMAAGILARELGLHIYKIDLSMVVSKYIGETEKQLSQIFLEAATSNAILLFDEADALFGKRCEVKDAHDRYANVETSYLLQEIEEYEGIVILTTNFRKNIDEAFARRMHHVIDFPFPDAPQRLRIWTGVIPGGAQVAGDVDVGFLARQLELAGGAIRNIALGAAFLAADEDSPMKMEHFILASAREMLKLGKLPSRSEFREYFDLIHSRV